MLLPKYMAYFERALAADEGDWLAEGRWTYADLSLFQLVEGLRYAFPQRMGTIARDYTSLLQVHMQVQDLPELRDYLTSRLRPPFNEGGIFRYYSELNGT